MFFHWAEDSYATAPAATPRHSARGSLYCRLRASPIHRGSYSVCLSRPCAVWLLSAVSSLRTARLHCLASNSSGDSGSGDRDELIGAPPARLHVTVSPHASGLGQDRGSRARVRSVTVVSGISRGRGTQQQLSRCARPDEERGAGRTAALLLGPRRLGPARDQSGAGGPDILGRTLSGGCGERWSKRSVVGGEVVQSRAVVWGVRGWPMHRAAGTRAAARTDTESWRARHRDTRGGPRSDTEGSPSCFVQRHTAVCGWGESRARQGGPGALFQGCPRMTARFPPQPTLATIGPAAPWAYAAARWAP